MEPRSESLRPVEEQAELERGERVPAQASRVLRLARELALSVDAPRAAETVARGLAELASGGGAAVFLLSAEAAPVLQAEAGLPLGSTPRIVHRALAVGRTVSAISTELSELESLGAPAAEALATPLVAGSESLGVVLVAVPPGAQLGVHPALLETAAELAGAAVANARRLALTQAEARQDPLTRLGNHRAFHEHLDFALRRSLAEGRELALVLVDLDDLKRINDNEGHPEGDRVLRELAWRLGGLRRTGEELFRVGGDEFAIVVEGGSEVGTRVAKRVRESIERAWQTRRVTLSAGVASFPADAQTKDELVHKADLALYAAKRSGRNTAIAYGADVLGGAARSAVEVLYEELHERMSSEGVRDGVLHELSGVTEAVRALGRDTTAESMLTSAARHLTATLGGTACVISRLDADRLQEFATYAPTPWDFSGVTTGTAYLLSDYPVTEHVLQSGEPRAVSLSDADVDPGEAFVLREVKMHAVLMLALAVGGRPWGLVEVYDAAERTFGSAEIGLAQLVVGHVEALLAQFQHAETVERLYRETLASLSSALEAKDDYTGRHAENVGELSVEVGRRLGLDAEALRAVELGALLHDIGKIRVPESILNKPGPLTGAEWEVMRTHPEAGERILAPIASLEEVLPIVRGSHERWDGRGYPDRLVGEEIPVGARIVAVCDAFRAMVEPRPYRDAMTRAQAIAELRRNAGTQFDPACVTALLATLDERERPGVVRLSRPEHLRDAVSS